MTVRIKYISLIIPIYNLNKFYPGGAEQYILEHSSFPRPKRLLDWHDSKIVRRLAMNYMDIISFIEEFKNFGLTPTVTVNNQLQWQDMCIVDKIKGPTLPCRWLKYNKLKHTVEFISPKYRNELST